MNGATFHLYRTAMGLDVTGLAERLGVNRRTVQRWEADKCSVPVSAAGLLLEMWESWLDRVNTLVGDTVLFRSIKDDAVVITMCRDRENTAINSVIATCLALADIQFTAQWS